MRPGHGATVAAGEGDFGWGEQGATAVVREAGGVQVAGIGESVIMRVTPYFAVQLEALSPVRQP